MQLLWGTLCLFLEAEIIVCVMLSPAAAAAAVSPLCGIHNSVYRLSLKCAHKTERSATVEAKCKSFFIRVAVKLASMYIFHVVRIATVAMYCSEVTGVTLCVYSFACYCVCACIRLFGTLLEFCALRRAVSN